MGNIEEQPIQIMESEIQYLPQFTVKATKRLESLPVASVIIPVYNEADIIFQNMIFLADYVGPSYELIVCDDCSSDGTYDILKDVAKQRSNIRLLRFEERIGKGGTIKKAVESARGEVVFFMDADLAADIAYLPKMLQLASKKNALVVSRRTIEDRLTQGVLRTVLSLGYNLVVRLVFRTGIKDHQCGFKAMKREIAERLIAQAMNDGFVFDTELIVLATKLGIPIEEVQVDWIDRRPRISNVKWLRTTVEMMKDIAILKISSGASMEP
jgi:glycosyltransferase involved in cell wall biosynthesis